MNFLIISLAALACLSVASAGGSEGCVNFMKKAMEAGCGKLPEEHRDACTKCIGNPKIHECMKEAELYEKCGEFKPCLDISQTVDKMMADVDLDKAAGCAGDNSPCDQLASMDPAEMMKNAEEKGAMTAEQQECVKNVKAKHGEGKTDEVMNNCKKMKGPSGMARYGSTGKLNFDNICKKCLGFADADISYIQQCASLCAKKASAS